MASYLFALALVAVCLPFAAPQDTAPVGTCSSTEVLSFFTQIPNPTICGPSVDIFYNATGASAAQFAGAIAATCSVDCGGAFAQYAYEACDDFFVGLSLLSFCLPTGRGVGMDRC